MKNYQREYPLFSLCGLNCALCPMHLNKYCPGCGGGEGNQSCAIFRCGREHGCPEYCFQCGEYPCEKYDSVMEYDSFLPHRNMRRDMERAKSGGMEVYQAELEEKAEILQELLDNYNDGRRKTFSCWQCTCWSCRISGMRWSRLYVKRQGEECRKRRKKRYRR